MDAQREMTSGRMASVAVEDGPATATAAARETTMKAVVKDKYGSSEVLELRNIDKPQMGDGNVLVRIRAAAVNPGDWAIMSGLPYIARPVYGLRKPKNAVRGQDMAGGGGDRGARGGRVLARGGGCGGGAGQGGGVCAAAVRFARG